MSSSQCSKNLNPQNRIFFHSSEYMSELPNECVQLAISFPPFLHRPDAPHLDKRALVSLLSRVHRELFRVLSPGGFLVSVNSDVRDRSKYNGHSVSGNIWWKHQSIREVCEESGFRCLGTKIWVKTLKHSLYRFSYAYIVFYSKRRRSLCLPKKKVTMDFKRDVWLLEGQTSFRLPNGRVFRDCLHPVLVERCVRQLSRRGDIVLTPFAGAGTVPMVARRFSRRWVGYEIDESLRAAISARLTE
jgi:DNA modification methylase